MAPVNVPGGDARTEPTGTVGAARSGPVRVPPRGWWAIGAACALILGVVFIAITHARPSFDAMGFMVWGHQTWHWNLNLDGAPSWKPLPFLATLPYALAGHQGQQFLWTLTAAAGGVASVLLAGRIAFRLTPAVPGRLWARWVAAFVAAFGMATMTGYLHLLLIANSDPWIEAFTLGAVELTLSRRMRGGLACVWMVALGRPEAWPILLLYAAWLLWKRLPGRCVGLLSLPFTVAIWFVVPGLTSRSWFSAGDLALGQATVIHGNKFTGVFDRLRTLTTTELQIVIAVAVVLALAWRERELLWLAGTAVLWAVIEIAFALHGWSAVQRYLIEPIALLLVVAGAGVGLVLTRIPGRFGTWLAALAALALVVSLAPSGRTTLRYDHGLVSQAKQDAVVLDRLADVIAADGGARAIRECGQPVSLLGFQSTLAWELDMNVGAVGFKPGAAINSGQPIVFFKPHDHGFIVHATHPRAASAAACAKLDRSSAFSD